MSETEQIIEDISKQAKVLLQNHWPDIADFRNGEESIKISFISSLKREGPKTMIETKISFAKRITDSLVDWIDPDQLDLELEKPAWVETAKRGRGRPKKNILEAALRREPARDPEDAL